MIHLLKVLGAVFDGDYDWKEVAAVLVGLVLWVGYVAIIIAIPFSVLWAAISLIRFMWTNPL